MWTCMLMAAVVLGQADPDVEALLAQFAARRADVKTAVAQFVQEDLNAGDTRETPGTVVYVAPRRIVFRYTDENLVYLVDGMQVYEYDETIKQMQVRRLRDNAEVQALFLGFDANVAGLKEVYHVKEFAPIGESCASAGLMLTPKAPEEERVFESVRLYLKQDDMLPCLIHIVNDEDSEVRMRLTNMHVNEPVKQEDATLLVPEGTTIISDGKLVGTVGPGGKRFPETGTPSDEQAAPKP